MDVDGSSCLIIAAGRSLPNLVEALIAEGADVNVKSADLETPLHAACLGGDVKCIGHILNQPGINCNTKNKYNETPYHVLIANMESKSMYRYDTWNLETYTDHIRKYYICLALMPHETKLNMIENLISVDMFKRLCYFSSFYSNCAMCDFQDAKFVTCQKIPYENLLDITMIDCIPSEILENGVDKCFLEGFLDILSSISSIMCDDNRLPTVSRVLQISEGSCLPNYKYFLENGGCIKYILNGIIKVAEDTSWEYGDGTADEDYYEDMKSLPKVKGFDGNFDYLRTVVLDYLLGN